MYKLYAPATVLFRKGVATSVKSKVQVTKGSWPKIKLACSLLWKPVACIIAFVCILLTVVFSIKRILGL